MNKLYKIILKESKLFRASYLSSILGLFGLGNIWREAHLLWGVSKWIGEIVLLFTAFIWVLLILLFILKWIVNYKEAIYELNHPIKNNYIGLLGVTFLLMAVIAFPYSYKIALILFVLGGITQFIYGIFFTERMWLKTPNVNFITPALYLPTVAGNFVSALVAGLFGFNILGMLFLGIGFFSWFSLESIIMNRLKKESVSNDFKPTLGIMMAPPAIAGAASISLNLNESPFIYFLIGYALFQFLIFSRILPSLFKEQFKLSFWAFSFGVTTTMYICLKTFGNSNDVYYTYFIVAVFILANLLIFYLIVNSIFLVIRKLMNIKTTTNEK